MSTTTAILIFGRHATDEAQQKLPRRGSTRGAQRLCELLLRHTQRVAHHTGLPVHWVSSAEQYGASFGQRLCHALDQVWAQGYEQVLLVGTDTPDLSVGLLQQAHRALEQGHSVLGAATDGGIYLLGIARDAYRPQDLAALPWLSANLFEALGQHLAATPSGSPLILAPVLADVDDWADVRQWIGRVQPSRWRLFLEQCATQILPIEPSTPQWLYPQLGHLALPCNRPPPMLVA